MKPLVIDNAVIARAKEIMIHAEAHVYSMDDTLDLYNKQLLPPGDIEPFTMYIAVGYRVVFSYEEQLIGKCRHISISTEGESGLPSAAIVCQIISLFGFSDLMYAEKIWMEPYGDSYAINIIEKV